MVALANGDESFSSQQHGSGLYHESLRSFCFNKSCFGLKWISALLGSLKRNSQRSSSSLKQISSTWLIFSNDLSFSLCHCVSIQCLRLFLSFFLPLTLFLPISLCRFPYTSFSFCFSLFSIFRPEFELVFTIGHLPQQVDTIFLHILLWFLFLSPFYHWESLYLIWVPMCILLVSASLSFSFSVFLYITHFLILSVSLFSPFSGPELELELT